MQNEPLTVLYVEDEESDAFFMRQAFIQVVPGVRFRNVADGQQALDYLDGRNSYSDRSEHPLPALVLLDLNLPLVSGFEVLRWMRGQPQFKELPVVVFSSSSRGQDKQGSDQLGADWYLEKPTSASGFREIAEQVRQRWLSGSKAAVGGEKSGGAGIRMMKLVQNKATKAFLAKDGAWTTDCRLAQVFPTMEAAMAAVGYHQLTGVELYYRFGEDVSKFDFTITLTL